MRSIAMKNALFILLTSLLFCFADAQKYKELPDLKSIVDAIKEDVDRHIKQTSSGRRIESINIPPPSKLQKSMADNSDFMESLQDSMHEHLIRNLGPPSDSEYSSTKSTTETEISSAESISSNSESLLENKNPEEKIHESSAYTSPIRVGSSRAIPGISFPDYTEIPITSFTCSDKVYRPGFYADLDAGCQVFHVCWPDRRETFLCPTGTIFNQALLACDYWYSSNCSLAPHYYDANAETQPDPSSVKSDGLSSMINSLLKKGSLQSLTQNSDFSNEGDSISALSSFISKFIPVKAKVTVFPESKGQPSRIIATASVGEEKRKSKVRALKGSKKSNYRSKPRQVPSSEHFILPTSAENEKKLDDLKHEVFKIRFDEMLDSLLEHVNLDASVSRFYNIVNSIVTFIRSVWEISARHLDLTPGSELYEYDLSTKQSTDKVLDLVIRFLRKMAELASYMDEKERSTNEMEESVTEEQMPPSHLNERFIVNPFELEEDSETIEQDVTNEKQSRKTKRSVTTEQQSDTPRTVKLNISKDTKTALLMNYIKLLKENND